MHSSTTVYVILLDLSCDSVGQVQYDLQNPAGDLAFAIVFDFVGYSSTVPGRLPP